MKRFKADGKNCGPGPRQLKVRLNSQIYLVCPNLPTVLQQRGHDVQTSNMKENIWLLHNKTAFDECDVSQVQVTQKTDFFICEDPTRLVFLSLLFLEHAAGMNDRTFVGGRTYYLIATSHGTQSSVNDLSGGHCNHTSKNVYMKIEVYVCNKTGDRICNSRNVGILTCPPPATAAPYTSPDITTLTQTEQRVNITESVVTYKSETLSSTKLPRTESKPTGTTRTGEKTTETTRARSTKNETKRGKRIAENEMRKTLNLWRTIAICVSCIAGVLLTAIVILVVRNSWLPFRKYTLAQCSITQNKTQHSSQESKTVGIQVRH
ncbi:PREDICTED: uncharacterized protein LOC107328763 isoform X2 [Acropora digitifera]|uniref:uncharacterized protein LOC107328763 isoform X2 n=1 Tax=Acropora digitifera TaxID=70779 RepID=UPI00077AB471|nr:PREDICTED: uncharacterized protein LOC107328763 isoform X2 [Acropora digitifera]